jgi:hypothetical protein
MRLFVLAVTLAMLAACAPPSPPASDAEPMAVLGSYEAASENARRVTGDLTIERAGIVFAKGQVLYTRALSPRPVYEATSRAGPSYASMAAVSSAAPVEFRRVTEEASNGAERLCGGEAASYVAIAKRDYGVVLLVFSGTETPSPDATQSVFCAAYEFIVPGGGPSREGVVLQ